MSWVAKTVLEQTYQETGMQKLIYLTTIQYVYVNVSYFNYRILLYQRKMLTANDILLWSSLINIYGSVQKWFNQYKVTIPDADWKSEINYDNVT